MPEVGFRTLDHEGVMRRLREYGSRELGSRPEVREAILIGSLARGDWSARSDADVVIVVDDAERPFRERGAAYAPRSHPGAPVDVLVYTEREREAWRPRFRAEIERGVVLYRRAA